MFTPDLDFNPILLDGLQPDAPLDDHIFTLPESSGEIYTTDLNEGNQIPLDETYSSNIHTGNTEPFLDTFKESFDDIFNVESNSPDMTNLALLDPELQPLIHAPDCKKFKSILCCNPKTEFIPAAVDECIWCMNNLLLLLPFSPSPLPSHFSIRLFIRYTTLSVFLPRWLIQRDTKPICFIMDLTCPSHHRSRSRPTGQMCLG